MNKLACLLRCWVSLALAGCVGAPVAGDAVPPPVPAVIAVNQVGYLPGGAKWALLWGAQGDEIRLVEAAGGRTVWQGPIGPAADWPAAGRKVQTADFSAFTQPGRYRLQVAGGPVSDEFVIAPEAYAALSAAALKAFYFNRAGSELKPEHAGPWARPAGHPDTQVRVHASAAGPGRPEGALISAPRGWYDAGDYNKYTVNSGIAVYTLLAAWEHFPAFFQAQRLNLPESAANGLPDLLNEVLWNLDWMLAMQDPADGGVYHKLTNPDFDGVVMPHQATGPRWVVGKSTAAALDFAAVAATASRVFREFDAQRPGHAARLLKAAQAAWDWAQAHPDVAYRQPPDIHTGEYGDAQLADEFSWAAAELYITTRDDRFWAALKPAQTAMAVPGWADVQGLGWISLAHHRAGLTAAADPQVIASRVGDLASRLAAAWLAAPERVGLQAGDYHWGSHSAVLNRAMVLIQGYRLTGTRAHLDAAQALLDDVLGRNALAMSGVTGFGTRSPRHPHHRPSEADGVAEPVPGFLVGGPNTGQQDARHCPVPYPSSLPALSYLDHFCSYASNEVAINWNAPLVYVSAALQVLTPPAAPLRREAAP
jgi:endoglucanase